MNISEKVAYLKGLMDGLALDETTKEGKILVAMADILEEMALCIDDAQDQIDEIVEVVDIIDEDLGALEEEFYDDDDCDCDCDDYDDDDYSDIIDTIYEVTCPTCGETTCLDDDMLDEGSMNCPNCGEKLEFDVDDILSVEDEEIE